MMMKVRKPPHDRMPSNNNIAIFLAGSIEQGTAVMWQDTVIDALKGFPIVVLNPRRDTWDPNISQHMYNPAFAQQVTWELDGLDRANIVFFYFDPATKSPISLLELGLMADTGKEVIVCCPEGYWRKGNVDIVCERFDIPCYTDLSTAIGQLQSMLKIILA